MSTVSFPINGGVSVLLDEEDVPHVERFVWSAQVHPRTTYAQANVWRGGQRTTMTLHRFIARAEDNEHVDHRNGDGLDCRKENLRTCLKFQNNQNARTRVDNTSGFKGVSWYPAGKKWSAGIMLDGKRRHIGYYATKEDAARAYDVVAQKAFGEFSWLNFPTERLTPATLDVAILDVLRNPTSYLAQRWAA
jgi:hypothetical protein